MAKMKVKQPCEDYSALSMLVHALAGPLTASKARKEIQSKNLDCVHLSRTLLLEAIERNQVSTIRTLLQAGACVDGVKGLPRPLTLAVHFGHLRSVRILLEHGAEPHGEAQKSFPPALVAACEKGYTDIVAALLQWHVRLDSGLEQYALALSCRYGYDSICAMLIRAGAKLGFEKEPSFPLERGLRQPLTEAVMHGNVSCMRLLLDAGAVPEEAAVKFACRNGDYAAFELLDPFGILDAGTILSETLYGNGLPYHEGHLRLVELILGDRVHRPTRERAESILRGMVVTNSLAMAERIIAHGVVMGTDAFGRLERDYGSDPNLRETFECVRDSVAPS